MSAKFTLTHNAILSSSTCRMDASNKKNYVVQTSPLLISGREVRCRLIEVSFEKRGRVESAAGWLIEEDISSYLGFDKGKPMLP